GLAGSMAALDLQPRHAVPADGREQLIREGAGPRVDRNALAQHAGAPGRRLFTDPQVRKLRDEAAAIEEGEHPDAGSDDALLDQRRVEGQVAVLPIEALEIGS